MQRKEPCKVKGSVKEGESKGRESVSVNEGEVYRKWKCKGRGSVKKGEV